jgi:hypothetical protein
MRAIATVAAVAAVWLLSGCGHDQAKAPTASPAFTISGTITLSAAISTDASTITQIGNPCTPDAGYEDIATGAQVTTKNGTGKVLALGTLGDPRVSELLANPNDEGAPWPYRCTLPFTVTGVPGGEEFYSIEVTHRGEVRYTRGDLNQPVLLSLGDAKPTAYPIATAVKTVAPPTDPAIIADCVAALKASTSTTGDRPAACATLNDDEYTDAVIAYTDELAAG